jgi:hypothetical protein
MAPRVPVRDGSTGVGLLYSLTDQESIQTIAKPRNFDPWIAIRALEPKMQAIAFALANRQLVAQSTPTEAAVFFSSYITSLVRPLTLSTLISISFSI